MLTFWKHLRNLQNVNSAKKPYPTHESLAPDKIKLQNSETHQLTFQLSKKRISHIES